MATHSSILAWSGWSNVPETSRGLCFQDSHLSSHLPASFQLLQHLMARKETHNRLRSSLNSVIHKIPNRKTECQRRNFLNELLFPGGHSASVLLLQSGLRVCSACCIKHTRRNLNRHLTDLKKYIASGPTKPVSSPGLPLKMKHFGTTLVFRGFSPI